METFDYNNDTNVEDLTDDLNQIDRLEKITKIKDFVKGLDTKTREKIEKNLNVDKSLGNLINERLIVPNQSLAMIPEEDTSRSDDVTFLKEVPLRRKKPVCKLVKCEFPINDNDNDIDLIRYVSPTRKCKQNKQENNKTKRQIVENEVEFVKKVLSHPRDRLKRRKIKSKLRTNRTAYLLINPENILSVGDYLKRLKRKWKSETPNEENFNKIIALEPSTEPKLNSLNSLHPRERYKRKAKQLKEKCDRNQLKFKGREASYLKYPKTVCDEEFLKEVPEFNFRTKLSERNKTCRNKIM